MYLSNWFIKKSLTVRFITFSVVAFLSFYGRDNVLWIIVSYVSSGSLFFFVCLFVYWHINFHGYFHTLSKNKTDNTRLAKAWTAIDRLSAIWKSDLTDKMKRSFFQEAVASILLYGSTTWTITKHREKKLDGNYTRMLRAILNKSWRQHPTKQQLYGYLPPVTKTIKIRRTRHAGHCWRSRDELVSDVLLWTPSQGRAKAGRPARTYIQQLCADTGCSPDDLPKAIDDREVWREKVRNIRADCMTWWWWWYINFVGGPKRE